MDPKDKKFHINFWYVIAAVLGMLLIQDLYLESTKLTPIPYSRFQTLLNENKVEKIAIGQNYISGSLKEAQPDGVKDFITARVDPEFAETLNKHGVVYSGIVESHWLRDILSWVLPAIFFVGIWMFAIRRMGQGGLGGLMQIGKSRARIYVEKETKVTFADVAGVDEAKDELVEIVNFLKDPQTYGRLGGRPPKGVLLVGPPGTGKTLLARAVAGEAGVPFFSISGSEFVELFVGVGAARVRDLLEQARQHGADVQPEQIAALTPGFTGADLANLVNEATLLATRRHAEAVTMADFTAAIERIVAGLEKRNRLLNPLERRVVAYHELGHAMVTLALPGTDTG